MVCINKSPTDGICISLVFPYGPFQPLEKIASGVVGLIYSYVGWEGTHISSEFTLLQVFFFFFAHFLFFPQIQPNNSQKRKAQPLNHWTTAFIPHIYPPTTKLFHTGNLQDLFLEGFLWQSSDSQVTRNEQRWFFFACLCGATQDFLGGPPSK